MDITNKLSLIRSLQAAGIRPSAYSVSGPEDMALCLEEVRPNWEVFYFERGGKTFSKTFPTEAEACEYMYQELMGDKTAFM
ncbi:hypothetical protein [Chitinimonas sp. BJB300]|uniref:hypothetical protein n=1 Tax=Chitinimonas sp. BJB300 TaxID=1559339 RepID=UPI0018EB0AAB|nr:hypothetical protein [Chitinimonas sp. BJB300]